MTADRVIYEKETAVVEVERVYMGTRPAAELLEEWLCRELNRTALREGPRLEK